MAMWEPQITTRAIRPVVAGLEALGHPTAAILRDAGLSREAVDDVDARFPRAVMRRVWESAIAVTDDDCLGIHLAEAAPVTSFEVHAYAMLASPTLREAYRRACRYQRLVHEVNHLDFDETPEEAVLHHALPGGRPAARHPAEFLATIWVRFGRMVVGDGWNPTRVSFAHARPADVAEHARVFRAPVHFAAARTAVHVAVDALDAPNPHADEALARMLGRYADGLLARGPRRGTLSDRVRAILLERLGAEVPTAARVARGLNLSVRSLHRGLAEEGTTFRGLCDQVRHEQAESLLADPRRGIDDVAFLLGFAELSSFYRAFRRWTSSTPAEFRRAARHPH
jgi:AraC-like DNA-binding protein